jgi:hypothetical protein
MKKYFTGFVVGMVLLGMSGSSVSAQTINANELVELFISLGIISGSQASTARSAVGTSNTGSISSSLVTQTPEGVWVTGEDEMLPVFDVPTALRAVDA